ncbi:MULTISPECIES: response regulator transcription factor [Micrococcaceae]|jgi:DNA-binding NarL/FixJ family response regulator|uniref:response regulator transcription factor n=1 Tax=Micrococcaceae TaxID=1268 RepID=UPI00160A39BC|nr:MULTISPECIES: response regulator transcription factor [Micrococcaceae]MBB5748200.1 DNA-binding NarL/FixJ family response regulator [Micrococcus sp. TA1]HRO30622.1 response regulator transcription factor [Citricoccus sp.]HRO94591.1 response regulator transcription factor [Citricoccus sp.]
MIRVLLADDEPLVRTGIAMILGAEDDIEVVDVVGDGRAAVLRARQTAPDVVVMDVRMPVMDGVEATRRILDEQEAGAPQPGVLVLSTFHVDEAVHGALRAGASGFVLKDAAPDELVAAVHAVARGDAWLAPAVAKRLLAEFKGRPESLLPRGDLMGRLTHREREVLILLAHGLGSRAMAEHLFLSEATVKTHLNRILTKLGVHDRAGAVAVAYREGLVGPNDPMPPRP